jgi:mannose-1-phosphate guanylyltransferase
MDAIVLVGGLGTRLRPLTWTRHKSLVPVLGVPAIEHLFRWLEQNGVGRAVLAIGQHNEDLAHAYRDGRPGHLAIDIVEESERLESGGGIRNAVETAGVTGPFLVLNGDVYVEFDLAPILQEHERRDAVLSMALYEVQDPSMYGVAVVDARQRITRFVEKPPAASAPSRLINAGVWVFSRGLVDEIPAGAVRVEETLFPSLVDAGREVYGPAITGVWADIGTAERYLALNGALLGERTCIDRSAIIDRTASIAGCSIGAASEIGREARVRSSILWERVTIGAGANVADCILADGVCIGAGASVEGAVAGRGAVIPARATVPAGANIEPGETWHGP